MVTREIAEANRENPRPMPEDQITGYVYLSGSSGPSEGDVEPMDEDENTQASPAGPK